MTPTGNACAALRPRPSRKQPAAFTLIELLVVIAIISVLAALLLPAFGRAKRKAKAATCVSNLHQIGVSLFVYIDENANYLPICAGLLPSQDTNLPSISATLLPYVKAKDIFRCPEDTTVFPQEQTSYEWNMYFNGALFTSTEEPGSVQSIIATIFQGRANTPLMGDADAFHIVQPPGLGRKALYFDGRVGNYEGPLPLNLIHP